MDAWKKLSLWCEETYGTEVNTEKNVFLCPKCGKPIQEDNFEYGSEMALGICPSCKEHLKDDYSVFDSIILITRDFFKEDGRLADINERGEFLGNQIWKMMTKNKKVIKFDIEDTPIFSFYENKLRDDGVVSIGWLDNEGMHTKIIHWDSHY
jgi:CRISPR/Cas system-associated protein Cas10 (large subunit of type III CRISPR-Cas system)